MNTNSTTVYGKAAYEGFARAIGSQLGLRVAIDDGAKACIDKSGTIYMPGMNTHQTADQFAVTCGVIVHELSHQFYRSHSHIDPNRSRLEHNCLNAVLDVADETWISKWFVNSGNTRPGYLLDEINRDAIRTNHAALTDWTNANSHLWKTLCVAIIAARLGRRTVRYLYRTTFWATRNHGVDFHAVARLVRRARITVKQDPNPTAKRFRKLIALAQQLATLLKPFESSATGAGGTIIVPIGTAAAAGSDKAPKGAKVATEQDGAGIADGSAADPMQAAAPAPRPTSFEFDAAAFSMLSPSVQRIADRIATDGDGCFRVDGLQNGASLGQAHRLLTDGNCLARWDTTEHADGLSVSVVLDCSGSMHKRLAVCAGIARAFATSMRNAGEVQTLVFGTEVKESDDFGRVRLMGSTMTNAAIAKSTEWLNTRSGQKWIVLITDGTPDFREATDAACHAAAAAGIRILAVGLECKIAMPHASIVTAADSNHLAIELDAAAHLIEGGAA